MQLDPSQPDLDQTSGQDQHLHPVITPITLHIPVMKVLQILHYFADTSFVGGCFITLKWVFNTAVSAQLCLCNVNKSYTWQTW